MAATERRPVARIIVDGISAPVHDRHAQRCASATLLAHQTKEKRLRVALVAKSVLT